MLSPDLSTSRASAFSPSAHLQATRALGHASSDQSSPRLLGHAARDLSQLVQQCAAEAARIEQRQRALANLQSDVGRRLAGERLAQELQGVERHAQDVAEELAFVESQLNEVRGTEGGSEGGHVALYEQVRRDAGDLDGTLADLSGLLKKLQLTGGLPVARGEELRAAPRRQGALEELSHVELSRAEGLQADLEAGHRQPPAMLMPELEGFVKEWNTVVQDPRGVGAPGADSVATDGRVAALQGRWAAWNLRTQAPKHMDPNEMTQWVMRQAYRDNTEDMRTYAVRLEFHTATKAQLRDELNRARVWRSEHAPQDGSKSLTKPFNKLKISLEPNIDDEGNWQVRVPQQGEDTDSPEVLQDYIREIEQALQTAGDDMQMAQIELQAMTQRQQQVLNTLSSLSKAQHETSMAILRKIGT